jgi:hypothetical protein
VQALQSRGPLLHFRRAEEEQRVQSGRVSRDGPYHEASTLTRSRLKFVETQMGSMQGALEELIRLQRAALPGYQPSPPQPHIGSHQDQISPLPATMAPQQSHSLMQHHSFSQRGSLSFR